MKKLLLSGFTTFHDHAENSSQKIVEMFKESGLEGFELRTIILPVAYSSAFETLKVEMDSFKPDFVVSLGLAGNRQKIEIEKVAINLIHSKIADNDGVLTQDQPIVSEGPAAYFSTLPVMEMQQTQGEFPVEISFSAGAYVCNYLMYQLLHYTKGTTVKAGFIHLPHLNQHESSIQKTLVNIIQVLSKF